jgi:hypothetical protein
MAEVVYFGEVGTPIRVTITTDGSARDVSTAATRELVFVKPDGTTETEAASLVTDGTDGQIQFITTAGFLDVRGRWYVYAHVVWPGGTPDFRTDAAHFDVL